MSQVTYGMATEECRMCVVNTNSSALCKQSYLCVLVVCFGASLAPFNINLNKNVYVLKRIFTKLCLVIHNWIAVRRKEVKMQVGA